MKSGNIFPDVSFAFEERQNLNSIQLGYILRLLYNGPLQLHDMHTRSVNSRDHRYINLEKLEQNDFIHKVKSRGLTGSEVVKYELSDRSIDILAENGIISL